MLFNFLRAAALGTITLIAVVAFATQAFAAAKDYKFEIVSAQPAGPGKTDVVVRLIHTPGYNPVPGAVIFQTRADMGPDGMQSMTTAVRPGTAPQPGFYQFQVDTSMAGNWALTLSAKVQGETETVTATVNFQAAK